MAQASIHIGKVGTGSFFHNDRTMSPSYAIDSKIENECTTSSNDALQSYYKLRAEAQQNYTERTGQKMQKNTIFLKEAIINLNDNHTLKDLEPIMKELEKKGYTVLQASIHRDEGHIDEETGEKVKNLHAHITLFNLDKEGKSVKIGNAIEYSKLQTKNAEFLGMERGATANRHEAKHLGVEVAPRKMRLDTHVFKRAMEMGADMTRELKRENVQLQKEVEKVKYDFQETKKQITALPEIETAYKRELHQLNSEIKKLNDQIKKSKDEDKSAELNEQKETKITELEAKIKEIEGKNTELIVQVIAKDQAIDQLKEAQPELINASLIVQLQDENKILKITKKALETEVSELKQNRAAVEIPQGDTEPLKVLKDDSEKWDRIVSNPDYSKKENFEDLEAFVKKNRDPQKVAIAIYNSHIVRDTGLYGKLGGEKKDEKLLMDNMAKEIGRLQNMLKSSVEMLKNAEVTRSKITNSLKTVVESTKTTLQAFFRPKERDLSSEVKKERTEPNLSNSDKIRGFIDQIKGNEPSKGVDRSGR